MSAQEFFDDDDGYAAWLNRYPGGYVINIHRSETLADAHLHDANCSALVAQIGRDVSLTDPYKKVCGETLPEVEQWATDKLSAPVPPCKRCRDAGPDGNDPTATPWCPKCSIYELSVTGKCPKCDED